MIQHPFLNCCCTWNIGGFNGKRASTSLNVFGLILIHGYSAKHNLAVGVVQRLWCANFITKLSLDIFKKSFTLLAARTVAALVVPELDAIDVVDHSVAAKTVVGGAVLRWRRTY